jgi:hypothetical protein
VETKTARNSIQLGTCSGLKKQSNWKLSLKTFINQGPYVIADRLQNGPDDFCTKYDCCISWEQRDKEGAQI